MIAFKDRLNEALEKRDMRPSELARLSGVNEGAISQYRKGKYKANQYNLEKIAKALNVPIAWLMGADIPSPFVKDRPVNTSNSILNTSIVETYEGSYGTSIPRRYRAVATRMSDVEFKKEIDNIIEAVEKINYDIDKLFIEPADKREVIKFLLKTSINVLKDVKTTGYGKKEVAELEDY